MTGFDHPARRPEQSAVARAFGTRRDPIGKLLRARSNGRQILRRSRLTAWIEEVPQRIAVHRRGLVRRNRDEFVAAFDSVSTNDAGGRCDDVPAVSTEVDMLARELP